MSRERIHLNDLDGAILILKKDDEEKRIGITCEDYPDCENCGDLDNEIVETGEENAFTDIDRSELMF